VAGAALGDTTVLTDLRTDSRRTAPTTRRGTPTPPDDVADWSWPPYAPLQLAGESFDTTEWAPSSTVWHPQLRVGRWTVLYRRSA
jgi:hypothetical protein